MFNLQEKIKDIDNTLEHYNELWVRAGDEELRNYYAKIIQRKQRALLSLAGFGKNNYVNSK